MTPRSTHMTWLRLNPFLAPDGAGGAGGDDAAAKAAADAAAATAAAAAGGKTPEQLAAAEAAKADQVGKDAAKAAADAKAAEDAAAAAKAAAGAPAKYELALPKDGLVDASDLARVEELARENNLPNDVAQSMVETTNAYLTQQANTWATELEGDKTYGGDKLAETQRLGGELLDRVRPKGTPRGDGLRKLLSRGVGNNLEVASFLADLGRMAAEDTLVGGAPGGGATEKKSQAEILYPNSPEFKKP